MEFRIDGELVYFECERCNEKCVTFEAKFRTWGNQRCFCAFCGAGYVLYSASDENRWVERITMGGMYLPPLEWNEIFGEGQLSGQRNETCRRQHYRTFWRRLGDFIHNR